MKTLIIGGCGYVGSCLMTSLPDVKSVDLEIFERNSDNTVIDFDDLHEEYLDLFDNIILLAGYSSFKMCYGNEYGVFNNNVVNFVNLLNKLTHQIFIYASSASVYGDTQKEFVDENTSFARPYNAYDASKQMIDGYAVTASDRKGRTFGLRFGTVNGYAPHLRTDVMLNAMVTTAWRTNEVVVYNGHTNRSILGTNDLYRAIYTIIHSDNPGGIYNLASFSETATEMGQYVAERMGVEFKTIEAEQSASQYDFKLSCDKFKKDFDFSFHQDVTDIVTSLLDNKDNMKFSHRNLSYEYK